MKEHKTMTTVADGYHSVNFNTMALPEYIVLFGNQDYGWCCEKEDIAFMWAIAIRNAKSINYGDVSLFKNGIHIRGGHNLNKRILDKNANFRCFYVKCIDGEIVRHYNYKRKNYDNRNKW